MSGVTEIEVVHPRTGEIIEINQLASEEGIPASLMRKRHLAGKTGQQLIIPSLSKRTKKEVQTIRDPKFGDVVTFNELGRRHDLCPKLLRERVNRSNWQGMKILSRPKPRQPSLDREEREEKKALVAKSKAAKEVASKRAISNNFRPISAVVGNDSTRYQALIEEMRSDHCEWLSRPLVKKGSSRKSKRGLSRHG